ncbi:uncharacterized protein LOC141902103 [Tubulanus polymorphus]|uniref:uncharacterized protein LOC141902103 n=1 Tax=Tubulanus polymorphus TaxID=672921 RepID=UPI003DA34F7C
MLWHCSICNYFNRDPYKFQKHLLAKHKNAPNFRINCQFCGATYANFLSYRTHVSRHHRVEQDNVNELEPVNDAGMHNEDEGMEIDNYIADVEQDANFKKRIGQFLLSLREGAQLSHQATPRVIENVEDLLQDMNFIIKENLFNQLPNLTDEEKDIVSGCFADRENIFEGLRSIHNQDKYFSEVFDIVKPIGIVLGYQLRKIKFKGKFRYKRVPAIGYYIPLLETLTNLLNQSDVKQCVDSGPYDSANEYLHDMCDGKFVKNHPVFIANRKTLSFLAYDDDIEIVNPIGTHTKKHKIVLFYLMLCNIPPKMRSKLPNIMLIAVAKRKDINKFDKTFKKLLANFVHDINVLYNGHTLLLKTGPYRTNGALFCFSADTPASNEIGGFKEGVGGAKKPCRICEIKSENLNTCFHADDSEKRDEEEHLARCDYLEELDGQERKAMSIEYGINYRSTLLDVKGFRVTECLVMDVMHVLLEGVCPMETKLLLSRLIDDNLISLSALNSAIENFEYSFLDQKDKPQAIDKKLLNNQTSGKLGQSAQEMKILMFILPFIIDIPSHNEYWKNWLRLQKIKILCLSPVISADTMTFLEILVTQHNQRFRDLYPAINITPKMHYLLHLPSQMAMFGPLRNHWCMRFEAKHAYFKQLRWKNFKNIPKSMAVKHQRWLTYSFSSNFLKSHDTVCMGSMLDINVHNHVDIMRTYLMAKDPDFTINRAMVSPRVLANGHCYMPNEILLLGFEEELPCFVRIVHVLVYKDTKYLCVCKMDIQHYSLSL